MKKHTIQLLLTFLLFSTLISAQDNKKFEKSIYSKNERKLLETISPAFIYTYAFPHHLPSSGSYAPNKKPPEDALDLIR